MKRIEAGVVLLDNARTPILLQRRPPMTEVGGELEVRSGHGERELRLSEVGVNSAFTRRRIA